VIIIFTAFCPIPNNNEKIIIGDNSGKLYIGELKKLSEIDIKGQKYQSILKAFEEFYSFESIGKIFNININREENRYPVIRNLIRLSDTEIIGHSDYGDIFLIDCKNDNLDIKIIRESYFNSNNRMYQIASVNPYNFITSGNWGYFWIYNRTTDDIWDGVKKSIQNHAHFALDAYSENSYFTNNYKGKTRIIDLYGNEIAELYGFDSNLQNIAFSDDLICAVDYNGNSLFYSKSSFDENRYIKLQTIDCDQSKVYPHVIFHKKYFYTVFPNSLWRFDPELENIQKIPLLCRDINIIKDNVVILTTDDLVIVNPISFTTPEDYIKYNYIIAGIIGYTDTGKSTFCYKMIYGEYKDDLGTTSGTLTWCLEFDNGDKIFIKDIPGQHDEIEFYFPKLKNCDLIFAMCKKKDSIKPWKDTIDMCEKLRDDYNIEHFIFLRSKSDDNEKAPIDAIKDYLEKKSFNKDILFDVSAKDENGGIEKIIKLLQKDIYWNKKKISSENKIKTKIISAIGEARDARLDKMKLEFFKLPGFEDLNQNILEKFIQKNADEGNIYYIPNTKEIIFDTEKMGKVESYILNLFSISEGHINDEFILTKLKVKFSEIEYEELKYYYDQFINYLKDEEKILEILPKTFIIKNQLKDELNIPKNLLCTEIKIDKSIQIMEIITLFENPSVKLECVAKKGFKFTDKADGIIYIEFPQLSDFIINTSVSLIRIYINNSEIIENFFERLYEKLREQGLEELPKILDFKKRSDDDLENLYYVFNFPEESPVIDFKKELIYEKGKGKILKKIQKELLKDLIALGNSSYLYNNSAYLVIGLEEKNGNYENIINIENQSILFQKIAYLCRKYLNPCFNISHISVNINELYKLVNSGKIVKNIPFTSLQKKSSCQEKIMILHITREPKECLELNETVFWKSKKVIKKILKGMSWIRIGSHTFEISNEERKKLFTI